MRLSADHKSADCMYAVLTAAGRDPHSLTVFVNGEQMQSVVLADDVEGWADVIAHDEHGRMVAAYDNNGNATGAAIVRVYGRIEFTTEALA